jgi:lysophospholipase L1-like esterase
MHNPPNHSPKSAWRFVLAVLIILGISGCSGGGGGGSPLPNQAPVATSGCAYDPGLNQPFNGIVSATDPEGQSLSYIRVDDGSKGSVTINAFTGEFIYTPSSLIDSRGADTFTFRACEASPSTVCSNVASYKVVHTPRVITLGDSITQGVTTPNPPAAERIGYRKPLSDSLTSAGYQIDFVGSLTNGAGAGLTDDEHDGHGACTADELVNGTGMGGSCEGTGNVTSWLDTAKPDVVLLHIGTNDISNFGGFNAADVNDVESILNLIDSWEAANWPVTVVLARIIINQNFPSATTQFNDAVIAMAETRTIDKLEWVNHENNVSFPGDYGDSLHPNTSGYQKMSDVWLFPLTVTAGTPGGNHSGAGILPKCP